jgi:tetrahydromethanopterin S-methyltransferase subunit F
MTIRRYSELRALSTFEDRFDYLKLHGGVGRSTFGFDRYINQQFYTSREWRDVRSKVIARDQGLDLGIPGFEIFDKIIIHHMNPMTVEDIETGIEDILNPQFLITTSHETHNAIHFGDRSQLRQPLVERRPGDTRLWQRRL